MDKEWDMSLPGSSATYEDYEKWLANGRTLSKQHSGYQWKLGDWLVTGVQRFEFGPVDGYLLLHKTTKEDGTAGFKGEKVPNYWKDAAAEVGMNTACLKDYARVAKAYEPKQRVKQLTFTHHLYAEKYGYARRHEYLKACLRGKNERPRSIDWLADYIAEQEGYASEIRGTKYARFVVPDEIWKKLKQLSKYYRTNVPELIHAHCINAIQDYISQMGEKVSLEKYGFSDGKWPFYEATEFNKVEKKKAVKEKKERKRRRQDNDPVYCEKQRQIKTAYWKNGPALKPVTIRRVGR